jgi:beta-glucosidase-like glycosyl hydrolase
MVLLKNDKRMLPLPKSVRRVAVLGPNANATETMLVPNILLFIMFNFISLINL